MGFVPERDLFAVGRAVGLAGGSRSEPFADDSEMNQFFAGYTAGCIERQGLSAVIDLRDRDPLTM